VPVAGEDQQDDDDNAWGGAQVAFLPNKKLKGTQAGQNGNQWSQGAGGGAGKEKVSVGGRITIANLTPLVANAVSGALFFCLLLRSHQSLDR